MEISIDVTPVNEHAPVFSSAEYSTSIAEDVSVGTSILRVTAVDQDDGLQGTAITASILQLIFLIEIETDLCLSTESYLISIQCKANDKKSKFLHFKSVNEILTHDQPNESY